MSCYVRIAVAVFVFLEMSSFALICPVVQADQGENTGTSLLLGILPMLSSTVNQRGRLTYSLEGDILHVYSSKSPTWRIDFAIGSGAPGGGLAIGVYIPAENEKSIVESRPFAACCSAVGLDNLEWRWREYGGGAGTRASMGLFSEVSDFTVVEATAERIIFTLSGTWLGVSAFQRVTTITPDGFTTMVLADYSGATGKDSMWWIISLFHPEAINAEEVTVEDRDTKETPLPFTPGCIMPLPAGITLPYQFNFPLQDPASATLHLLVTHLGEQFGDPNNYEFWDQTASLANNYMFYPRWRGSFQNTTYMFEWSWRFTMSRE